MMRRPTDLVLVLSTSPGSTCAQSGVMIARARKGGIFELLSTEAWARVLGYAPAELDGMSLRQLMSLEEPAAGQVVAALLGESDGPSLEVTLRCKDERRKSFRFHRRFDPYQEAMYVVADEVAVARLDA